MGINYYLKHSKELKSRNSNKNIKNDFFTTLSFWGNKSNLYNTNLNIHLLGKRDNFGILNTEHHIEMLKRTIKFSREISKIDGKILFVNDQINTKFDGIIKTVSLRSGESYCIGKWVGGSLTKNTLKLPYKTMVVYNPKKSVFLIKEANKLGLPIISLCDINVDILETMYPILCNNSNGDSLLYFSLILSNSIIEGKLFYFAKQILKN